VTTTTLCTYEAPSPTYPRGRIVWRGVIGPDLNHNDAASAVNELYIRFNVTVDTGVVSVQNEATIDSDRNGDGDTTDPGEQIVYTADAAWQRSVGALPATGFAPNRVTDLSGLERTEYETVGDIRLEIPSLGVNIPIVGVPLVNGNWDVNWLLNQAGWLEGTAFPSLAGNSVLTSHVYLPSGLPGPFVSLSQLRWGDRIIVHAFGNRYVYEVRSTRLVNPDDTSVLRHEDLSWLTLITCRQYDESIGAYRYRVVVRAVLLEVTPEP
jgi:LPXTG-site transpeptidase (sortase) family protein